MTSDLHDIWRERQEIGAALDAGLLADDDPACERFPDLDETIREARPTDPAGLAIQMRLLADQFAASGHVADEALALKIATALENLGQAGQNGKQNSRVDFAEVASGSGGAPAQRPPGRFAMVDRADSGRSRRLDQFSGNKKAPVVRRLPAEHFVGKVAALVWRMNIGVIIARAWWMRGRAAAARRPAAAFAHSGNFVSTACGPSLPRSQGLAVASHLAGQSRSLE